MTEIEKTEKCLKLKKQAPESNDGENETVDEIIKYEEEDEEDGEESKGDDNLEILKKKEKKSKKKNKNKKVKEAENNRSVLLGYKLADTYLQKGVYSYERLSNRFW